ncbi:MAG: pyruvoyl-dependent arginine decarboxylase [Nitrososphaeraceae archaeon]
MESNHLSYVPRMIFFTKGKELHKDYLTSFEVALRDASIGDLNLVFVSSIKPPQCKMVAKDEGRKYLKPGQILETRANCFYSYGQICY